MNYQVIMRDPATNVLYELMPKTYSFSEELNKEATAQFTFSFKDVSTMCTVYNTDVISLFTTKLMEIWIDRLDRNNVFQKIFYGVISDFSLAPSTDGDQDFTIYALSWFGLLGRRYAGFPSRVFTATDAGAIAWTLIDESQASNAPYSDLGITMGSITASKDRDRVYYFDEIKKSITYLSNNNLDDGFDFDIDNTKAFNVYYPTKGQDLPKVILDSRTLQKYSYKKPLLLGLTNRVYAVGSGDGDQALWVQHDADGPTYKANFVLLEKVIKDTQIITTPTLDDKALSYLSQYREPVIQFNVEHYDDIENSYSILDYALGDTLRVNFPELGMTNATKRVIKRDFSMDVAKSIGYVKTGLDIPVNYG